MRNTTASILAKVEAITVDPNGCKMWPFGKDQDGYPTISLNCRTTRVHRVVLAASLGRDLGQDEQACHSCDVPSCVNVDHLWAGTVVQNLADRDAKGRTARNITRAKLSPEQVASIRSRHASGERNGALARAFAVSPATITEVTKRSTWAHVT